MRDMHNDLVAWSHISSCMSQNALKLPAVKRERKGTGLRDNCLTEKGGRKLGICGYCGSSLQLFAVHGYFA
jgi:hypothetical protein